MYVRLFPDTGIVSPDVWQECAQSLGRHGMHTKVAVVGCGNWGRNLARQFAALDALGALCDHHPEHLHRLRALQAPTMSWRQVLSCARIPAVAIATPPASHFSLAMQALEAGKHCFVEKPLTLCARQSLALCREAKSRNLRLLSGHLLLYHPAVRAMHRLIQEGALGRLLYLLFRRMSLGVIRSESVLWDLGAHDVSLALHLAGGMPERLQANAVRCLPETSEQISSARLFFAGGLQAMIENSWLHPVRERLIVVAGTEAMLVFDDTKPEKLLRYRHRFEKSKRKLFVARGATEESVPFREKLPLQAECEDFLRSIQERRSPFSDGNMGHRTVCVLEKLQDSIRQDERRLVGRVVSCATSTQRGVFEEDGAPPPLDGQADDTKPDRERGLE